MRRPKSVTVVCFQDHSPIVHIRSIEVGPAPAPNVCLSFVDDVDWPAVLQLFEACADVVRQHMAEDREGRPEVDFGNIPPHELADDIPF